MVQGFMNAEFAFFAMLIDIQALQFPRLIDSQAEKCIDDLEDNDRSHNGQHHRGTGGNRLSHNLIRIPFQQTTRIFDIRNHCSRGEHTRQQRTQRAADSVNAERVQ